MIHNKVKELTIIAEQVRRDVIRMISAAKSGHTGGSLGCTDLLVALYFNIMKHDPTNFTISGHNEDVFILSNGHVVPALYSVLARTGYFATDELKTFRQLHSRLQGHPSVMQNLPGIRFASGSLGQGLSCAIGIALSKKLNGDNSMTYVLLGDGELQEGQIWEAVMYCGSKKIDNLIAIVDVNGQQIDGSTNEVMPLGNLRAKFEAFDWLVLDMDGNDMEDILETIRLAKICIGHFKPIMILMHTEMGRGVDFMTGSNKWHGIAPNDTETELALLQLSETIKDF